MTTPDSAGYGSLPPVLDPASGGRMFYFDKTDDRVLFGDIRELDELLLSNGQRHAVKPDVAMDYRCLQFPDETFRLVIFDPPHSSRAGENAWLTRKYGRLDKATWREDLKAGFAECFRVLEAGGVLIFKWAETDIKVSELLALTDQRPLIGHKSGKQMGTHWITFIKETDARPHERADFNGRTVCTCGDFNCASLDTPLSPGNGDT